jgi:hypothetical protein
MAVTVIVETGVGVEGANSYASVSDADAYFLTRPRSDTWTPLTDDQKGALLIHGTRLLDAAILWDGERVSTGQALAFPRLFPDADYEVPVLPPSIKVALYELAITLNARDLTADPSLAGITSLEVGPIKIAADTVKPAAAIPRFVRDILSPYGTAREASASVRLIRR